MRAELEGRRGLDRRYVVAVLAVFVDEDVSDDDFKSLREAAAALQGTEVERAKGLVSRIGQELAQRRGADMSNELPATRADTINRTEGYRFLLVLELADRSLSEVIVHDRVVAEDFFAVRKILADLVKALSHMHANGIIHADLKPLNAVRVGWWQACTSRANALFSMCCSSDLPMRSVCDR